MKKHLEEIFELKEKDLDFLLNEVGICSLNLNLDLQANAGELYSEDIRELGLLHGAINSKDIDEKMRYLETKLSFYERAINLEFYEQAGEIKKELEFFIHSFLGEPPAKYLGSPARIEKNGEKR